MPIEMTPITPPEEVVATQPTLATVEEATNYFQFRMKTEGWDLASAEEKLKALYTATRMINRLSFKGTIVDATQDNKFPRNEYGTPDEVIWACCEEALSLLNDNDNDKDLSDLHVKSSSTVGFSTTVNELMERPWIAAGLTSPTAWRFLVPYLRDSRSVHVERV